jgi:hypothetical protein
MAFDPLEGGGGRVSLYGVCSFPEVWRVLCSDPALVFPFAEVCD